ncbi:hypothetical protein C8F04DRAFT_323750 [Mycena alexandri]|uniref:Transmembrane protein n=1 Tax=Mycena alexandri TaxID=1745969 RepID=A0AAD6X7A2_9AGAR|nr:hypothetical protein C8F04DRAFT_323750 [Mycena alexandri]
MYVDWSTKYLPADTTVHHRVLVPTVGLRHLRATNLVREGFVISGRSPEVVVASLFGNSNSSVASFFGRATSVKLDSKLRLSLQSWKNSLDERTGQSLWAKSRRKEKTQAHFAGSLTLMFFFLSFPFFCEFHPILIRIILWIRCGAELRRWYGGVYMGIRIVMSGCFGIILVFAAAVLHALRRPPTHLLCCSSAGRRISRMMGRGRGRRMWRRGMRLTNLLLRWMQRRARACWQRRPP